MGRHGLEEELGSDGWALREARRHFDRIILADTVDRKQASARSVALQGSKRISIGDVRFLPTTFIRCQ